MKKNISKNHKNTKFVIVGSGPDYEHYINLSNEYKISNNVIFTNNIFLIFIWLNGND